MIMKLVQYHIKFALYNVLAIGDTSVHTTTCLVFHNMCSNCIILHILDKYIQCMDKNPISKTSIKINNIK